VRVAGLISAVAAVALLAPSAGARSSATLPTLYVKYTMSCTFTITTDSGAQAATIPPGNYQIDVRTPVVFAAVDLSGTYDMTACKGFVQFDLSGPGVSVSTTLQDGDEDEEFLKATLQPGATYVAQDANQPAVARVVFNTSTSGAAGTTSSSSSSSTSSAGPKGETQQSLVGSAAVANFHGSLDAIVYAPGKLSLTRNGKNVTSLRAGSWTFSVDDESHRAGFAVQMLHGKTQTITGAAFVGSRDVTLALRPGRWSFFSPGARKTTFYVVS
jgi:hypothetical protein